MVDECWELTVNRVNKANRRNEIKIGKEWVDECWELTVNRVNKGNSGNKM